MAKPTPDESQDAQRHEEDIEHHSFSREAKAEENAEAEGE